MTCKHSVLTATAFCLAAAVGSAPLLPAQSVYPTGTTILDPSKTYAGYTLFATPNGVVILVDLAGTVTHKWYNPIAGERLSQVEPLANGHLLCGSSPPGSNITTVLELDWEGEAVWTYRLPAGLGYIHHDIERLPNGNTLLLCAQTMIVPSISPIPVIDDFLIEVSPAGTVVWSWFTYQHFNEFGFDTTAKQLISAQGGAWAHTNSADPLPPSRHTSSALRAGNIVLSHRNTNIIFIIDRTTGAVVWKTHTKNNLTQGQHAPYMIPADLKGAGNILVFDNGAATGYPLTGRTNTGRQNSFSRVLEIDPSNTGIQWDYDASKGGVFSRLFFSDIVSNAQRLPNGNTLICSGVRGRIFEVTRAGETVWEYMSPFFGQLGGGNGPLLYRAWRVAPSWLPYGPPHLIRAPACSPSAPATAATLAFEAVLKETEDPRILDGGDRFDRYRYTGRVPKRK